MRFYIILFLLASLSFAQYSTGSASGPIPEKFTGTLLVNKTAPSRVNLSDQFEVMISITNPGSSGVSAIVSEFLGNVEPISQLPQITDVGDEENIAAAPPRLSWDVSIAPGTTETVSYTVKPKTVGILSIGPTEVVVSNAKFFSNSLYITVECTASLACDESQGETPLNCPSKCGGNASETPPEAPELAVIPTDPIPGPLANPESIPPGDAEIKEKTNLMWIFGGAVVLVLAVAAYLIFFRKK